MPAVPPLPDVRKSAGAAFRCRVSA